MLSSVSFFLIPSYCNPSRIGLTAEDYQLDSRERRVPRVSLSHYPPSCVQYFTVASHLSFRHSPRNRVSKLAMCLLPHVSSSSSSYRKAPFLRLSTWCSERHIEERNERTPDEHFRRELSRAARNYLGIRNRGDSIRSLVAAKMTRGRPPTTSRTWCRWRRRRSILESHRFVANNRRGIDLTSRYTSVFQLLNNDVDPSRLWLQVSRGWRYEEGNFPLTEWFPFRVIGI